TVASGAVILLGATIVASANIGDVRWFAVAMLVAGSGWLVYISLVTAPVQALAPDWARPRVLAVVILILQGGLALGRARCGVVATRVGLPASFLLAGLSTI